MLTRWPCKSDNEMLISMWKPASFRTRKIVKLMQLFHVRPKWKLLNLLKFRNLWIPSLLLIMDILMHMICTISIYELSTKWCSIHGLCLIIRYLICQHEWDKIKFFLCADSLVFRWEKIKKTPEVPISFTKAWYFFMSDELSEITYLGWTVIFNQWRIDSGIRLKISWGALTEGSMIAMNTLP